MTRAKKIVTGDQMGYLWDQGFFLRGAIRNEEPCFLS